MQHPTTKHFHQYLDDNIKALQDSWLAGKLEGEDNLLAISRAQTYQDIKSLYFLAGKFLTFANKTEYYEAKYKINNPMNEVADEY